MLLGAGLRPRLRYVTRRGPSAPPAISAGRREGRRPVQQEWTWDASRRRACRRTALLRPPSPAASLREPPGGKVQRRIPSRPALGHLSPTRHAATHRRPPPWGTPPSR